MSSLDILHYNLSVTKENNSLLKKRFVNIKPAQYDQYILFGI